MLARRDNKRGASQQVADDWARKGEEALRKKREEKPPTQRANTRAESCLQRADRRERSEEHLEKVESVVAVVVKVVEKVVGELVEKLDVATVMEELQKVREDGRALGKANQGREATAEGQGEEKVERAPEQRGRKIPEEENGREFAERERGGTGETEKTAKARAPEHAQPPLTPSQQKAFQHIFELLLQKAGRSLDFQGFQCLLKAENFVTSEAKAHKAFRRLDSNRDGHVGLEDFCRVMTNTNLYLQFVAELPDSCPSCELQKGYVGNTVFFEILLGLLVNRVISEDAIGSIAHYYYASMQKAGLSARGEGTAGQLQAGNTFLGMPVRSLQALTESTAPKEPDQGWQLSGKQVTAFYEVFQMLVGDHEGHIGSTDLLSVIYQMQIPLKNPLIPDNLKLVALNSGREVDFEAFLSIMSDHGTFAQFLAPQCLECRSSRSPELLPFQLLLKLVATPLLKARHRGAITSYYREKFRECLHLLPNGGAKRAKHTVVLPAADGEGEPGAALGKQAAGLRKARTVARRRPSSRTTRAADVQNLQRQAKAAIRKPRRTKRRYYQQRFKPAIKDPYFHQVYQEYTEGRPKAQHQAKASSTQ